MCIASPRILCAQGGRLLSDTLNQRCVCVCASVSVCVCVQLYSWESFEHFQPSFENTNVQWNIKKRDHGVVWNAAWIDSVSTEVALLLTRLRALQSLQ